MVRAISEPLGDTELGVYLTGRHGNARLLTGGNDFFQTQLAIAENGDKSNKHADLRFNEGVYRGQLGEQLAQSRHRF